MEEILKYFIEDTETGLWYANTLHLQPMVHTFGKGWDKPFVTQEQYWTNDPNKAFCWFTDRDDARKFLDEQLEKGYLEFMTGWPLVPKKLVVTEHMFI
jgi:hypothetical protein